MTKNAHSGCGAKNGAIAGLAMPLAPLLALLSASCCVLPIGLSILGFGGAWLAVLGPFVAYRGAILWVMAFALVWSWFRIIRPKPCETRRTSPLVWALSGSSAFLIALSSPLWQGEAQHIMWNLWRDTR